MTKELIEEEAANREAAGGGVGLGDNKKAAGPTVLNWKSGDKAMAIWRVDGKFYSATVDQVLEDGTCTVIFDGYSSVELTQVRSFRINESEWSNVNIWELLKS